MVAKKKEEIKPSLIETGEKKKRKKKNSFIEDSSLKEENDKKIKKKRKNDEEKTPLVKSSLKKESPTKEITSQLKKSKSSKIENISKDKSKRKNSLKSKEFYIMDKGKYVLGDVDELFESKIAKKIKTSINKKISKINHGKDEKLGIHFFKVKEKVWDVIDYNIKILTANKLLILCKNDIIKEGKLKFCKRFDAKDSFKLIVDYTDEDYCLYFQYEEEPSPFMMLQDEALI